MGIIPKFAKNIRNYKPGRERHHEVVQPSQFPQNAWPAGSTRVSGPGRPQAAGPASIFGHCYFRFRVGRNWPQNPRGAGGKSFFDGIHIRVRHSL